MCTSPQKRPALALAGTLSLHVWPTLAHQRSGGCALKDEVCNAIRAVSSLLLLCDVDETACVCCSKCPKVACDSVEGHRVPFVSFMSCLCPALLLYLCLRVVCVLGHVWTVVSLVCIFLVCVWCVSGGDRCMYSWCTCGVCPVVCVRVCVRLVLGTANPSQPPAPVSRRW